ncbi:hypothetical protein DID88_006737 [Monilinia fructigena]|uniref:Reverse transcriptase domain-containing protein n=1 Tax=Monilinia fructigena TaxID=38457 RepID=A0A395IG87_9HELO|nr:hypothetical protein DID88_006737 [Monilinia fructigena]
MDDDRSAEPTISGIGTTARALADAATSDWWSRCLTGLSASYRKWGLGYSIAEPPELRLPRTLLHRLLAARTAAHGDFAQYHRRFGHTDAELNCLCGYAKTPEHLVFCEISQRKFHAWPAKPERPPSRPKEGRRYMSAILAHPKLFEDFLTVTQYFAINARAQQTRDLTSPGGPQQSYGLPRQNRHSLTAQSIRLAAAGDNGAANAPKADDRERGRVHAGAISPIPLTLPAHRKPHKREATLRRAALESYAKAVEAFVRNSPEEQKKLAQEIQEGTLAYLNQYLLGTAAAKQPPKISYAGALKTPNTTAVGADPSLRRVALQKRAALPKQVREPEATGTQTVRPSTAGNPTRKSQREKTDLRIYARAEPGTLLVRDQPFLIREAITKAVPQISAKDIPRLWATPTGWAVKPTSMLVHQLQRRGPFLYPLGSSEYSKLSEKKKRIELYNPGCQEYCSPLTCRRNWRACTAPPRCAGCHGPFPAGHKHCAAAPKRVDGKITRLTASQLGERSADSKRPHAERANWQPNAGRNSALKNGVQVVIPTPGARVAAYEAAAPQPRRVKRKTAPTGSLNLAELSKRSPLLYYLLMLRNEAGRSGEDRATARANGLKIAWANVGKSGPAHIALLQLAFEEGADVVCVQEPSVYPGTKTQNHPAYECYAPVDSWEQTLLPEREAERPRAMSYTRKAANLATQQRRNGKDRDIVWLEVNGYHIVNIYREPNTRRMIEYVTSIQVPSDFLIGGDFNAKHDMFEPGVESSNQGASLAAWSLDSGADFIGEPGEPTHRAGHTIDLTFSNIPFAETTYRKEAKELIATRASGVTEANLPRFASIIHSGITHLPQPTDAAGPSDLNDIAELLTTLFQNAIKAVGRQAQIRARSAPWWTPACANLHASYARASRRSEPDQETKRREMLSTIRNAKRDYWRRVIDGVANDVTYGASIESTKEKAEALLEKVLHRYDSSDDLDYDPLETGGRRPTLPWTTTISLEEVEKDVIGVSSTSPGSDRVTVRLLKACWQHIRVYIRNFFQKCLELSHFPSDWKLAEVVMIPKAGKKDKSSVRSWRPIALLSCIGKGLERLVARRLSWEAIHYGVISPQHGGALPKRSAVDLVASFVYDAETAFAQSKEVTLVTLDVQGAFDALMPRRLLERMRKQGWPMKLLRLIGSFLADRRPKVRLEGIYTAESRMQCGTPQGSPLSPVLPVTATGSEQPALRWLGVWIDRKLSFKRHVTERTTKAMKLARHIKGLAGVKFGPPAASLRKAVVYMRTILRAAATIAIQLVSTRLGPLIEEVDRAIVLAARGVLPVWRTAPTASVLRDAGLPSGKDEGGRGEAVQYVVESAKRGYNHSVLDGSEQYNDGAKLVGIIWSPGHMGIEGNEMADELADAGAKEGRMDNDRSAEPTISGIGTTARALANVTTSDWWRRRYTGLSASYRKWELGYAIAEPPELRLPRTSLHRLLAARTAHGDFAQYHRRVPKSFESDFSQDL